MATEQTDQQMLVDQSFEATVPRDTLELVCETLAPIVDEAVLEFTLSEIHAAANDMANVEVVDTGRHAIDATDPMSIGISPAETRDALRELPLADDLVLTHDPAAGKLTITANGFPETVTAYDPDSIREAADVEGINSRTDFEVSTTVPAWDFLGTIRKVATPAEHTCKLSATNDGIRVAGNDETDESDDHYPYVDTVSTDDLETDGEDNLCLLSSSFLLDLANALPIDGEVSVQFGSDQPLLVSSSKGPTAALAPRRKSEADS